MRILLVEDTVDVGEAVAARLERMGHAVDWQRTGPDAEVALGVQAYDLVVLDVMLPGKDGIALLSGLRARGLTTPVLMLTARARIDERVNALDFGADDYLTKPFHAEELLARLRALMRRAGGHASAVLACGALQLDTRSGRVTLDGQAVALTSHEYRLLEVLMHRQGAVLSRAELTEHLYAQDFERDSNTIEVFIARLRRKLPGVALETVRGLGYRLSPP